MITDKEWDKLLDKIIKIIPDSKFIFVAIDGTDVTRDKYHQATNLEDAEIPIVMHVLKQRANDQNK